VPFRCCLHERVAPPEVWHWVTTRRGHRGLSWTVRFRAGRSGPERALVIDQASDVGSPPDDSAPLQGPSWGIRQRRRGAAYSVLERRHATADLACASGQPGSHVAACHGQR